MSTLLNLELTEARRHEMERSARRKRHWPDDGLPARGAERGHRSLNPAAVLARLLSWR